MSLFLPHRPLAGIAISAPEAGLIDTTGADGSFGLLYLHPESTLIVASGVAVQPCTLVVPPETHQRQNVTVYLNALPEITYATVASTREETWWPDPYVEWITLTARVEDDDGMADVDSVYCTVLDELAVALTQESTPGTFKAIIDGDLVAAFNAEDYVGGDFSFTAHDKQGAFSIPRVTRLIRVVRDVGVLTEPTGLQEVDPQPTLHWVPPAPSYSTVLRAKVIRVDSGVETTAWQSPLLPALTDSTTVTAQLGVGTYYWVLQTIDSFGNLGQSREAAFKVVS